MSDFAYSYFNSEMEKMSIPDLKELIERAKALLFKKEKEQVETNSNLSILKKYKGNLNLDINLDFLRDRK